MQKAGLAVVYVTNLQITLYQGAYKQSGITELN